MEYVLGLVGQFSVSVIMDLQGISVNVGEKISSPRSKLWNFYIKMDQNERQS